MRRGVLGMAILLASTSASVQADAFAHVKVGSIVPNAELPVLKGGKEPLLKDTTVNLFVFFRPGQENSQIALRQLATCEAEMAGKSIHWVAIVSSSAAAAAVAADVKGTGIKMPVVVDKGDALYGRLGVFLHPVVGITDRSHRLVAYLPFTKVNYCDVIRGYLRHTLGEITAAELEQIVSPPKATQGGDASKARRHLNMAEAYLRSRKHDKAVESARKGVELDPTLVPAHVVLGKAQAALGDCRAATKAFAEALRLDARNVEAAEGTKACREKAK